MSFVGNHQWHLLGGLHHHYQWHGGDQRGFHPTNTTITFYPGESDKQVQVPIINNGLPEGNRTVIFTLTNVVNAVLFSPSNATLTINDSVVAPAS